ncbi:MAG: methyltransferase domain-containing protein [Pseudomonadota bacterium]
MSKPDEMGLTREAADGYEAFFVPAIFHQWPPVLIAAAQVGRGEDVLDAGCGTGVLTRELTGRVGDGGSVTGFDLSESMLDVAKVQCPAATFRQGDVAELPFDDCSFDVVFSSFMLMFVPDPVKALSEMGRVLRADGRLIVSVWEGLENNVVYRNLVEAAREIAGIDAANSLAWPFTMGDSGSLESIFESAGMEDVVISHHDGKARFPSVDEFVSTEVQAWLLSDSIERHQVEAMVTQLRTTYLPFQNAVGAVSFPLNARIGAVNKSS